MTQGSPVSVSAPILTHKTQSIDHSCSKNSANMTPYLATIIMVARTLQRANCYRKLRKENCYVTENGAPVCLKYTCFCDVNQSEDWESGP